MGGPIDIEQKGWELVTLDVSVPSTHLVELQ